MTHRLRGSCSLRCRGFTLVELMVAVVIVGILATIAIPNFLRYMAKAKQAEARTSLKTIYIAEVWDQSKSEAALLRKFAIESGLSSDQIIIDPTSRNTHENAVNTAALVRERGYDKILLITSAFHMWRAEAAFNKQGLFPEVYPVDFRTSDTITVFSFLPSVGALSGITGIIHELVGLAVYRLQGYI